MSKPNPADVMCEMKPMLSELEKIVLVDGNVTCPFCRVILLPSSLYHIYTDDYDLCLHDTTVFDSGDFTNSMYSTIDFYRIFWSWPKNETVIYSTVRNVNSPLIVLPLQKEWLGNVDLIRSKIKFYLTFS